MVLHKGNIGTSYCIGGGNIISNIELIRLLISILDNKLNESPIPLTLIQYISIDLDMILNMDDSTKIKNELGWNPVFDFNEGD